MKQLIYQFLAICLQRAGPQDLPDSPFLLKLVITAYLLSGIMLTLAGPPLLATLTLAVVNLILLAILCYLLLWLTTLTNRFIQTLSALAGCSALINTATIPILIWVQLASETILPGLFFATLLLLMTLFWHIITFAHILKNTLNAYMPIGIALSLLYTFISFNINKLILITPAN